MFTRIWVQSKACLFILECFDLLAGDYRNRKSVAEGKRVVYNYFHKEEAKRRHTLKAVRVAALLYAVSSACYL